MSNTNKQRIPWHQKHGHRPDAVDEFIDDSLICLERMSDDQEDGLCGWNLPCTRHPKGGGP